MSGLRSGPKGSLERAGGRCGGFACGSALGPRTQATGGATELSGGAKAGKPLPSLTGSSARGASGASSGKGSKEQRACA
eukprot:scaffold19062_cov187-Isochrysis_galbana.AAC.1